MVISIPDLMNVLFNGDAIICCYDWNRATVVGNVRTSPMREIWNSDKMNEIRQLILRKRYKQINSCRECSLAKQNIISTVSTTLSMISSKSQNGHYVLIQKFIKSIPDDTEPPVTLQEARAAIEVVEKVNCSNLISM